MSDFLEYVDWFTNRTKQWARFLEMLDGRTEMAVMLIEAPTLMGKTFLIKRMAHHCEQQVVPHVYVDFAGQEVASYLWLARQVREQLGRYVDEKAFNALNERINQYTDPRHSGRASGPRQTVYHLSLDMGGGMPHLFVRLNLLTLREKLIENFSHGEMRDLAFSLGLKHDDIEGTIRSAYALGLIIRCEADGLLPKLLISLNSERPAETWWDELAQEELAAWQEQQESNELTSNHSPAADSTIVSDLGYETLPTDEVVRREAITAINRALLDCLSNVSHERRIVFLFDSYERGNDESDAWLNENLLAPVGNRKLTNALLFVAGQQVPPIEIKKPVVGKTGLALFTEDHVREYIEERRKIEPEIDFFKVSKGNPYVLATVVSNMTIPTAEDDSW